MSLLSTGWGEGRGDGGETEESVDGAWTHNNPSYTLVTLSFQFTVHFTLDFTLYQATTNTLPTTNTLLQETLGKILSFSSQLSSSSALSQEDREPSGAPSAKYSKYVPGVVPGPYLSPRLHG